MPPIGETLRDARMRQKLDIVDVEERTKIRAKYLRALENEEWSSLPGPTYVKTFLRTYAEVVGVDPHLLVEEFRSQHERPDEADFQPVEVARARRSRRRERGPGAAARAAEPPGGAPGAGGRDRGAAGRDRPAERRRGRRPGRRGLPGRRDDRGHRARAARAPAQAAARAARRA